MSIDATRWAWQQRNLLPSQKLVLLSLADRASEDNTAWPSAQRLHLDTGLNRKTILAALTALCDLGLIADTGRRAGKTQGVRVFHMPLVPGRHDAESGPKNGTVQKPRYPKSGTPSGPKSGTTKRSQKRDIEPTNRNLSIEPSSPPNGGSPKAAGFVEQYAEWFPCVEPSTTLDEWMALRAKRGCITTKASMHSVINRLEPYTPQERGEIIAGALSQGHARLEDYHFFAAPQIAHPSHRPFENYAARPSGGMSPEQVAKFLAAQGVKALPPSAR